MRSRSPRRRRRSSTLAAFATVTFVQAQRIAYERDVATAERTRAEQVSSFLVELFELSDPSRSRGNQVTARELLDIGARRVSLGLADQPETRATLLGTIGTRVQQPRAVLGFGRAARRRRCSRSIAHSRRAASGGRQRAARRSATRCAIAAISQACEERLDAALDMQRELLGPTALEIAPTLLRTAQLAQLRGDSTPRSATTTRACDLSTRTARSARPTRRR